MYSEYSPTVSGWGQYPTETLSPRREVRLAPNFSVDLAEELTGLRFIKELTPNYEYHNIGSLYRRKASGQNLDHPSGNKPKP